MQYTIQSIATVRNNRQMLKDDHWGEIISTIELADHIQEASLKGIEDFSHLEIIFILIRFQTIKFNMRQDIREIIMIIQRLAFSHKEVK